MQFQELIKRLIIDILTFIALVFNLFFLYTQIKPFFVAAIALNQLNGQTIFYMLYCVTLFLFPMVLIFGAPGMSKTRALRWIFYSTAAIIVAGTISDLITYKFFIGYHFLEGNSVFVNIMWNIPNIWGAIFSIFIAVLYFFLGKLIKIQRRQTYALYVIIFVLSAVVPLVYTYFSVGSLPRSSWVEKGLFIITEQFLIMLALTVCVSSRGLWTKHIWQ